MEGSLCYHVSIIADGPDHGVITHLFGSSRYLGWAEPNGMNMTASVIPSLARPMICSSNQARKICISSTPLRRSSLVKGTAIPLLAERQSVRNRSYAARGEREGTLAHQRVRIYGPTNAGFPNFS